MQFPNLSSSVKFWRIMEKRGYCYQYYHVIGWLLKLVNISEFEAMCKCVEKRRKINNLKSYKPQFPSISILWRHCVIIYWAIQVQYEPHFFDIILKSRSNGTNKSNVSNLIMQCNKETLPMSAQNFKVPPILLAFELCRLSGQPQAWMR